MTLCMCLCVCVCVCMHLSMHLCVCLCVCLCDASVCDAPDGGPGGLAIGPFHPAWWTMGHAGPLAVSPASGPYACHLLSLGVIGIP